MAVTMHTICHSLSPPKPSAVLVFALVAVCMWLPPAFAIVIDGYDDDWTHWDTSHTDPNEVGVLDYWDIQTTLFKWEPSDDTYYFYWNTYSPVYWGFLDAGGILIDADQDSTTGGSVVGRNGLEYVLAWDMGNSSQDRVVGNATLFVWDDDTDSWVASGTYPVARGTTSTYTFVEWSVPHSALGTDTFYWSAYYQALNGWQADYSPDTVSQLGFVPEPATPALVGLGMLLLSFWRRRSRLMC